MAHYFTGFPRAFSFPQALKQAAQTLMSSAIAEPVFSLPLNHFRCASLVNAGIGARQGGSEDSVSDVPTGLGRFVGDQTNQLLRIFARPESKSPLDNSLWSSGQQWPLVFFGPSGTGKTSLALTFLANLESKPTPRIRQREQPATDQSAPVFMTAVDFDRRYRSAMETDSVAEFRSGLIRRQGILIDNLHELANKTAVQLEMVAMIDAMTAKNRPILFTMQESPQLCNQLLPQLVSRLAGGLTLPVAPPGPDARHEIVAELAEIHDLHFSHESISWLVNLLPVTVPGINHFMLQFKTYLKSVEPGSSDRILGLEDLTRWLSPNETRQTAIAKLIFKSVAREFNLKASELSCQSRKQTIVMARGIAIYLNRKLLNTSFKKIGQLFGNRDHSTIMHAYRKIEQIVVNDDQITPSDESLLIQRSVGKLKQQLAEQITEVLGLHGKPVD